MKKNILLVVLASLLSFNFYAQSNVQIQGYFCDGSNTLTLNSAITIFEGPGTTPADDNTYDEYILEVSGANLTSTLWLPNQLSPITNPNQTGYNDAATGDKWINYQNIHFDQQYNVKVWVKMGGSWISSSKTCTPKFESQVQFRGYYCAGNQWVSLLDPVRFYEGPGSNIADNSYYDEYKFEVSGINNNLANSPQYLPANGGYTSSAPTTAYWKDIADLDFGEQYNFTSYVKRNNTWHEGRKTCTPFFKHRVQVQGYFCHGNQLMQLGSYVQFKGRAWCTNS